MIEYLTNALRESQLAVGTIGELAKIAQERPEGLPVLRVQESLVYARGHLMSAAANIIELEKLAAIEAEKLKARQHATGT